MAKGEGEGKKAGFFEWCEIKVGEEPTYIKANEGGNSGGEMS